MTEPSRPSVDLDPLRIFVGRLAALVESTRDENVILDKGSALLGELIRSDRWLPDQYASADPTSYRQYLLHCDSRERFCVVSFVWGPGQATPIHDHTVWGLVGVLRGAEREERYSRAPTGALVSTGAPKRLEPGRVSPVSPRIGDIHRVSNAFDDRTSVSIHVYGANIGAVERSTFDSGGHAWRFVSGYSNRTLHRRRARDAGGVRGARVPRGASGTRSCRLARRSPVRDGAAPVHRGPPVARVEIEAPTRMRRRDTLVVLYEGSGRCGGEACVRAQEDACRDP